VSPLANAVVVMLTLVCVLVRTIEGRTITFGGVGGGDGGGKGGEGGGKGGGGVGEGGGGGGGLGGSGES
jgi:hypothetical protein